MDSIRVLIDVLAIKPGERVPGIELNFWSEFACILDVEQTYHVSNSRSSTFDEFCHGNANCAPGRLISIPPMGGL